MLLSPLCHGTVPEGKGQGQGPQAQCPGSSCYLLWTCSHLVVVRRWQVKACLELISPCFLNLCHICRFTAPQLPSALGFCSKNEGPRAWGWCSLPCIILETAGVWITERVTAVPEQAKAGVCLVMLAVLSLLFGLAIWQQIFIRAIFIWTFWGPLPLALCCQYIFFFNEFSWISPEMEMNKRAGGGQEGRGNDFQFLGELYKQLN